jgi:AcrR family transcriptional regulator
MTKAVRNLSRGSERSAETRQRLIEAALDLFGTQGYEGTTTRALAEQAQVNLAAIPYHFGGKEKLYRTIASHVAGEIRSHLRIPGDPFAADAEPSPSPAQARAQLHILIDRLVDTMTLPASARWARFITREQLEPSAAFEILYEGFQLPLQEHVCRLLAAASSRADGTALRLQGIALFGQIFIFRWGRPAVLRRLEAENLGPPERAAIKRMLHFNLDAILDCGGMP